MRTSRQRLRAEYSSLRWFLAIRDLPRTALPVVRAHGEAFTPAEAWKGGDLRLTQGGDRPPRKLTMPSEWQYHADGVKTGVTTRHDLDGRLKCVRLQLDCFKIREWTEEEKQEHTGPPSLDWNEREEVYEQFADGSHATLKFDVNDGVATLSSIQPKDSDEVRPEHMPLLKAAERVLDRLTGVDEVVGPMDWLISAYEDSADIYIERIDG